MVVLRKAFQKGGSIAVSIPISFADQLELKDKTFVSCILKGDRIIIMKATDKEINEWIELKGRVENKKDGLR